jgi:ATP-dependent 26S proteasome regulatory subunit
MKSNPITALSDLFGKLVIEHGSAVIQEKHIALLKEQFTLLEKENTNLKSKIQILETENQNLKEKNGILTKKIQIYEKSSHIILLDEIEVNILLFLARQENTDITPEQIAQSLNANLQIITFNLEDLRTKKLVGSRPIAPFDHSPKRFWSLAQEGRRYLIKHKLIS